MTPFFKHDCGKCVFLGNFNNLDLYWCPQFGPTKWMPTVIARFSDDPPDYHSGMNCNLEELVEAKQRALKRGLPCENYSIRLTNTK